MSHASIFSVDTLIGDSNQGADVSSPSSPTDAASAPQREHDAWLLVIQPVTSHVGTNIPPNVKMQYVSRYRQFGSESIKLTSAYDAYLSRTKPDGRVDKVAMKATGICRFDHTAPADHTSSASLILPAGGRTNLNNNYLDSAVGSIAQQMGSLQWEGTNRPLRTNTMPHPAGLVDHNGVKAFAEWRQVLTQGEEEETQDLLKHLKKISIRPTTRIFLDELHGFQIRYEKRGGTFSNATRGLRRDEFGKTQTAAVYCEHWIELLPEVSVHVRSTPPDSAA